MREINGYKVDIGTIRGAAQFCEHEVDDAALQRMLDSLTDADMARIWDQGVKSPASSYGINEREEQVMAVVSEILNEKGLLPEPPEHEATGPDIPF